MTTGTDRKLERLAKAGLVDDRSLRDLVALGRLGDVAHITSGDTLRDEGSNEPWSYCVLSGAALLSSHDEPVAVAGPGGWVLGHVPGRSRVASPLSVVAGTDLELLAFRPGDFAEAMRYLKVLPADLLC